VDGARYKHLEGTVDHVENCHALNVEIVRFSSVMATLAPGHDVTTCPGWTVLDLAEHLGVIHRWAEELVRLRSPVRIARDAPTSLRDDVNPERITEGGDRLIATLLAANPDDEMWAWGLDQHVRFWSRRQLHETLVHRMDLELAAELNRELIPSSPSTPSMNISPTSRRWRNTHRSCHCCAGTAKGSRFVSATVIAMNCGQLP